MPYLQPSDYASYGLPDSTTADWMTAASSLINTYCRRPDLNIAQYTERMRLVDAAQCVRLSYLPLAPLGDAASPIVSAQARYAKPRRGEIPEQPMWDIAWAFALPGQWTALDATQLDCDARTGELTLRPNVMGLPYNEIEVTYTAGLAQIGDDIKCACAQIVRNAQAQPALNASRSKIDTMQMQYFSSSLLDDTVRAWLRPYVAGRMG
jgi:hypothetical protein